MSSAATDTPDTHAEAGSGADAVQRVVKVRRDYNDWVARESLEDYALRFTPHSFRKWSEMRVANTAFGAASFLVLEAVGATLLVKYGFVNAFWAILGTGLIIFLAGLPISHYAARYGLDMDLLTRGAGFGYIGSTVTSLIYASFTFVFFALEAAIMAYALELAFGIPPSVGYLVCALAVIPLVTHGVTAISKLQVWTQPLWLLMLVLPYAYALQANPGLLGELTRYAGDGAAPGAVPRFELVQFGAAMTVGIALITQMGEQADYLRFMPERTKRNRWRWLAAVFIGGPGWVGLGVLKMLGGALLAYLAISHSVPADRAVDPNQMYLAAYEYVFPNLGWAVAATALFVVISQLKINVTNAYAGSLAWSNFFARLTHSHPGRVVWVVFNTIIALMLMELDVFQALANVLGLYSNIAIAWMMAVVADLVVNKPLGLSPAGIEFKRAHLYDINPVGVGAMGAASVLSIVAYVGWLGPTAQAFSAVIAMVTAFVAAPLIAWATGGRYYIARQPVIPIEPVRAPRRIRMLRCCICERTYESDDMAHCPAYQGDICSLCCSLDARCHDLCKPAAARASVQIAAALRRVLPRAAWPYVETGVGLYLLLMAAVVLLLGVLFAMLYHQELRLLGPQADTYASALRLTFTKAYAALLLVSGIVAWWLVLTHKSRQVAQEESNRQTHLLMREIDSHRRTDEQLQKAKLTADLANQAKTRYISTISHELRTPLNSILGYAQLLGEDAAIPPHRRQAVSVILRGGDHLLSLIEGTLDIARIESGKLTLDNKPMRFQASVQQIAHMFELQAAGKGIGFRYEPGEYVPDVVRCDEKRLRQILINVLGNAVKFTSKGRVLFKVSYKREMALFEVEDTGPGIATAEIDRIFEPFARGSAPPGASGGTGLGLTIGKMLTDLMGGEMTVASVPGQGSVFRVKLFLPELHGVAAQRELPRVNRVGYVGERRRVLVVDNEEIDRELLVDVLQPLGFEVRQAESGEACLAMAPQFRPHAILMDLAMPGIDGWQTIRMLRQGGLAGASDARGAAGWRSGSAGSGEVAIAVVSANAFDKGQENDVGIDSQDFILKPVRVPDLLDWLGRRLALQWMQAPRSFADTDVAALFETVGEGEPGSAPRSAGSVAEAMVFPSRKRLEELGEVVELGYYRGIVNLLDRIAAEDAEASGFVAHMRQLARRFELDAMSEVLQRGLDAH